MYVPRKNNQPSKSPNPLSINLCFIYLPIGDRDVLRIDFMRPSKSDFLSCPSTVHGRTILKHDKHISNLAKLSRTQIRLARFDAQNGIFFIRIRGSIVGLYFLPPFMEKSRSPHPIRRSEGGRNCVKRAWNSGGAFLLSCLVGLVWSALVRNSDRPVRKSKHCSCNCYL